jgi:hypothetical protein
LQDVPADAVVSPTGVSDKEATMRELDHALLVRGQKEKSTFVTRPQRRWFAKCDPRTSAVLVGYTTDNGEIGTAIITAPAARVFNYICDRIKINEQVDASGRQRQFESLCSEAYWMLRVTGEFDPEQFSWTSIRSSADTADSSPSFDDQVH